MQADQNPRSPTPSPRNTRTETLRALRRGDDVAAVSTDAGLILEATPVDPSQVYEIRLSELGPDGGRDPLLGGRIAAAGALPALQAVLDTTSPDLMLTRADRADLTEQIQHLAAALHHTPTSIDSARTPDRTGVAAQPPAATIPREGHLRMGSDDTPRTEVATASTRAGGWPALTELQRRRPGLVSVQQAAHAALDARAAAHEHVAELALAPLAALIDPGQDDDVTRRLAASVAAEIASRPEPWQRALGQWATASGRAVIDTARERQVLAVPVSDEQVDAANTRAERDALIDLAACQNAIRRLRDDVSYADTARDALGLYLEARDVHGQEPEQARATAWLEVGEGTRAEYETTRDRLAHAAEQRAQQRASAEPRGGQQTPAPDATDSARRWAPFVRTAAGEALIADPAWPGLAAGLDRAAASGWDVAANLPRLVAQQDLPARHPARELYCRLIDACDAAAPAAVASAAQINGREPPATHSGRHHAELARSPAPPLPQSAPAR
jgi:hypothetical protein